MENQPKEAFNDIVEHFQDYVDTQKEIIKLQTVKHVSSTVGNLTAVVLFVMFLMITYLFLNVALALYLSIFISTFTAFLYVAIGNLLVGILIYMLRNTIVVRPIQNLIIKLTTE